MWFERYLQGIANHTNWWMKRMATCLEIAWFWNLSRRERNRCFPHYASVKREHQNANQVSNWFITRTIGWFLWFFPGLKNLKEIWWNGCQFLRCMCPWHWCTYFLSAVQHIFPAELVYSKGLANRSSICFLLSLSLVLIQFVSVHFSSPCLKVPQTFVFPISAKYIESSLDRHHHWLTTALWENGTTNFNYCERNVRSACLQLGRYLD
jgi:hypothetical protein